MLGLKPYLAHKKHVIWDWNGTLLDDVDAVVEVIGELLDEQGLERVNVERYRELFCFPIREYYRRLGFDLSTFQTLSDRYLLLYAERAKQCRLHRGATDLFDALAALGIAQSILSAAEQRHLDEILGHHGVRHHFDHVYGLDNNHAASKVERGRELLAAAGYLPAQTIIVGDTDHDLEVGQALGVDVLLLADGHQSFSRLKNLHSAVVENRHGL